MRRRWRSLVTRTRRDRGSTSLVAVGLLAVAATLVAGVGAAGALAVAASRAQGAADACALAVAYEARDARVTGEGRGRICGEAYSAAAEWGVRVTACRVDENGGATVTVDIRVLGFSIERSARAGWG